MTHLALLSSGSPEKTPIVFLHGGGLSSKMWQPVIERLPEFYCLAPDLPEHGGSRALAPFDLEDAARRVADLAAERIPGGRAHWVGLSLGGAVAMTAARLRPETFLSGMVSGTTAGLGRFLGGLSLASLWMLRLYKPEDLAKASAKQWGIPEAYMDLFKPDLLHSTTVEFNRALIQSLMGQRLPETLNFPLLATVGEKETLPAKQAARQLNKLYPTAVGRMVPGLGHVWALQDPALFSETVRAWVAQSPLPESLRPL